MRSRERSKNDASERRWARCAGQSAAAATAAAVSALCDEAEGDSGLGEEGASLAGGGSMKGLSSARARATCFHLRAPPLLPARCFSMHT